MSEWLASTVAELRQNFRLADAVDIVIIAIFLYAVMFWFRRAASRRMLLGVLFVVDHRTERLIEAGTPAHVAFADRGLTLVPG